MATNKRIKYRLCGYVLPPWLPVAKRLDGAMLPYHLSQQHPNQVGPYLERMRIKDIGTVAAEGRHKQWRTRRYFERLQPGMTAWDNATILI
jgi:hypothetical protein